MDKWWLVTWTTYGTWLPGDPRGFRTWRGTEYVPPPRRYADPGEETYQRADYADRHATARELAEQAVALAREHQDAALSALLRDITEIPIHASAIAVGTAHVHLLAKFAERRIRQTAGRLKAAATRAIHEADPAFRPKRIWAKECHMKSKETELDYRNALNYIKRHIHEGALVHVFSKPTAPPT
jgi:hypothetical protein